ncbi:MAG: hypothetical protein H6861_05350 [Rhodospirillales bacterium]|nr:hypothetical protein [Rhodospirillales bacterium]
MAYKTAGIDTDVLKKLDLLRELGEQFDASLVERELGDCPPVERMGHWENYVRECVPQNTFLELFGSRECE